jgi:hypothetical protein
VAPVIPTIEPTRFAANTTVKWTRAFGEYRAADGWVLKYAFRGADTFDVTADGTGSCWAVTVTPALTATKAAGGYRWSAIVTRGAANTLERYAIASGRVVLTPDVGELGAGALQDFAERAMPIIEAAILGRLTSDQETFQIDGTMITHIPMEQLVALRNRFSHELRAVRGGGRIPGKAVCFGRA